MSRIALPCLCGPACIWYLRSAFILFLTATQSIKSCLTQSMISIIPDFKTTLVKMTAPPEDNVSSDFPFELHRVNVLGSKMAYIDTKPDHDKSEPTALFLHGNPTSSYLWRNIILHVSPVMRCVAPDLIGMGHSSKPENLTYRFTDHYTFLLTFISKVIPSGPVILVFQDWGSGLGLHWAHQQAEESSSSRPSRVLGMAFMEFIRPFPKFSDMAPTHPIEETFRAFRDPVKGREMIIEKNMFIEVLMHTGLKRKLTDAEMDYYRRPYLDPPSREPIFMWPNQIPIEDRPSDVYDIATRYHNWLLDSDVPKLMFWGSPGRLVSPEKAEWYMGKLKNVKGVFLGEGMHFLQEDHPHRIGEEIKGWAESMIKK